MLYLDYSRKEGEWEPNCSGSHETSKAIDFLNEEVRLRYRACSRLPRESDGWTGVSRTTSWAGLGFSAQVEHGMDERHSPSTCTKSRFIQ